MRAVDGVVDLAVTHQLTPDDRAFTGGATGDLLPAVPVHLDRAPARDLPDLPQTIADGSGRAGGRLAHVDLPVGVKRVRQVDPYPGQLRVLVLLHAEPEPVTGNEQPALAVHVEALVGVPSLRSASGETFGLGQLAVVRE